MNVKHKTIEPNDTTKRKENKSKKLNIKNEEWLYMSEGTSEITHMKHKHLEREIFN